MEAGISVRFRKLSSAQSPKKAARPFSARQFPSSGTKCDHMATQLLANSRELARTHLSLVRSGRFAKPVHATLPAPVEEAVETVEAEVSPVIQTTVVRKEQGTSPLTTFQDSYLLADHYRSQTLQPVVHNIDIEAFQPPKSRKGRAVPSHRALLAWKVAEFDRNGPSATPDKMTPFNSHVLKEYHGLFVAPGSLGETTVFPYRATFNNPLSNKRLRKMSDPGSSMNATNSIQLHTAKPPATQQAVCDRIHPARVKRFTKRPLSASYSFRNTKSIFDPYDVYNVASGLFVCR